MLNNYELKNLCKNPAETSPEKPAFKTACKNWIEYKKRTCIVSTINSYQSKVKLYLLKAPFAD